MTKKPQLFTYKSEAKKVCKILNERGIDYKYTEIPAKIPESERYLFFPQLILPNGNVYTFCSNMLHEVHKLEDQYEVTGASYQNGDSFLRLNIQGYEGLGSIKYSTNLLLKERRIELDSWEITTDCEGIKHYEYRSGKYNSDDRDSCNIKFTLKDDDITSMEFQAIDKDQDINFRFSFDNNKMEYSLDGLPGSEVTFKRIIYTLSTLRYEDTFPAGIILNDIIMYIASSITNGKPLRGLPSSKLRKSEIDTINSIKQVVNILDIPYTRREIVESIDASLKDYNINDGTIISFK